MVSIVIFGLILWFIFQTILATFGNFLLFFGRGIPTDKGIVNCENNYQIKQETKESFAFIVGKTTKKETLLIKNSL